MQGTNSCSKQRILPPLNTERQNHALDREAGQGRDKNNGLKRDRMTRRRNQVKRDPFIYSGGQTGEKGP